MPIDWPSRRLSRDFRVVKGPDDGQDRIADAEGALRNPEHGVGGGRICSDEQTGMM